MGLADILVLCLTVVIAGLLGGIAMEVAMWLITRTGFARGNMIVALGSLITRSRDNAWRVGVWVHAISAIVFAAAYAALMLVVNLTTLPAALGVGLGLGFFHGLIVSLALIWVVAEQHPLDEFRGADFAIGLSHLAGHIAFGVVVGLAVGISPV